MSEPRICSECGAKLDELTCRKCGSLEGRLQFLEPQRCVLEEVLARLNRSIDWNDGPVPAYLRAEES